MVTAAKLQASWAAQRDLFLETALWSGSTGDFAGGNTSADHSHLPLKQQYSPEPVSQAQV